MSEFSGLTLAQVEERRKQGQGNDVALSSSRSITDIVRTNVFNPVNIVLYVISLGLTLVGDFASAFATIMLVIFNAVVGIVQEVRAKQQLDQIALLARTKVTVRRAGEDQQVDPAELVLGDWVLICAGDQIPVDGVMVGEGKLEVDESALTGESDLVTKQTGDKVLSGTFCISGKTVIEATNVGESSFANQLTQNARKFSLEVTPLQRNINLLLRLVLLIVSFFALLAVLALFILDLPLNTWLQVVAVITGSVSAGLLTLITLNYSWGAVRIGQNGGLVQQLNAIESLSNITVLCTDKTGTLTANRIHFHDTYAVTSAVTSDGGLEKAKLNQALGDFAASASALNKTSEAILAGLPGIKRPIVDEVPFSSARKWSALAFDDAGERAGESKRPPLRGVYVLGALEMLRDHFAEDVGALRQIETWSNEGLRVLVFAGNLEVTTLHDAQGEPSLPPLTLFGVLSFSDELRPHLRETIAAVTQNDVKLKVISGDNPQTVAALARQAGFPGDLRAVSGPELEKMSRAEFAQAAEEATVFGRISPQQKEALVDALRSRGEYVAMIGDGVNDVLSLKKANLGVAMESGSTATRSVAAIVLLGDSFAVMPQAFSEGQRIVNSIQEILKLFMVTVFALLLLVGALSMLGIGFPFTTLQSTLLAFFTRGIPPLVLALTATATRHRKSLGQHILEFTIPASLLIFFFGLLVYIGVYFVMGRWLVELGITPADVGDIGTRMGVNMNTLSDDAFRGMLQLLSAQTALTTFFVLSGILLMVFAQPPVAWLSSSKHFTKPQWLPTIAAAILIVAYGIILAMPGVRTAFDLVPLPLSMNLAIVGVTLLWAVTQLFVWRNHLLERFMGLPVAE